MREMLQKVSRLNHILQDSAKGEIPLQRFYDQLCEILGANVYLFRSDGSIFCRATIPGFRCSFAKTFANTLDVEHDSDFHHDKVPDFYLRVFREEKRSIFNYYELHPQCDMGNKVCDFKDRYYTLIPVFTGTPNEAGILFVRYGEPFSEAENLLCEYACAIVSMEILYRSQIQIRHESWQHACSKMAVNSLSVSELRALLAIFSEIGPKGGQIVLSTVATQTFVAKSLLTGTLKKLEGAGVITTRSMGVKGTQIDIVNEYLLEDARRAAGVWTDKQEEASEWQKVLR